MRRGIWIGLACALVALLTAAPASAFRSPQGAKPTVRIMTKDLAALAKAKKIRLRVTVGTRARVRLRVLVLDAGRRPAHAARERKVRFPRASGRFVAFRLNKAARRAILSAIGGCRDLRFTAFASGRRLRRQSDDPRTTLVKHTKALKHRRRSGCGPGAAPGAPLPGG
ncbi:MAG: hypothetical protein M3340_10600, partial [Actinomycetota bacterium]|nr:hypothetical protein [Actinomycetota bacterium]